MKLEWRKQEKEFYLPKEEPGTIRVPTQSFFAISGSGHPNSLEFAQRVEVLYTLAHVVRMLPKTGCTPEEYREYTVLMDQ